MKNPKLSENPLGFVRKKKNSFLRKFHMKSKYFSYEKLTISETFQNRRTTQYQFFHFIWWEKIF